MTLLDMVGPVMVGPSSSHTAGACRLGLIGHHLLGGVPTEAELQLHGSFAKTGRGHGTHLALLAGLLGYAPDDARLPRAKEEAQAAGLKYRFVDTDLGDVHPNTVRLELSAWEGRLSMMGASTGGGIVDVWEVQGLRSKFSGGSPTLLMRYDDAPGVIARVTGLLAAGDINIATLTCARARRHGQALLTIEMDTPPHEDALAEMRGWAGMHWLRLLPRLMDG